MQANPLRNGFRTSEGRMALLALLVPVLMPVVKALFARIGLPLDIDPETIQTAILANAGVTGSYALGRSFVKAKAAELIEIEEDDAEG